MSRPIQGWSLRAVPTLRRSMLAGGEITSKIYRDAIDNPQLALLERLYPGWRETHVRRLASNERAQTALAESDLFWVAADMCAQALDASQDIPGFTVADFVTPRGLVLFETPLPPVPTGELTALTDPTKPEPKRTWAGQAPLWALSWYPDQGVYRIIAFTRLHELPFRISPLADLQGLWEMEIPVSEGMVFAADEKSAFRKFEPGGFKTIIETGGAHLRSAQGVLAFLAAMNVLMNTPTIAERHTIDARTGKPPRPSAQPTNEVTVIDLRPLRYEPTSTINASGHTYHHRWVVRGHWAMQAHGPKQSLRKLIYREPYIKGPPDAPLLATERVYAWRR